MRDRTMSEQLWGKVIERDGIWKERRSALLGELKQKVQCVNFLIDQSELIAPDEVDFKNKIDQIWNQVSHYFGSDTLDKAGQVLAIEKKINEVYESLPGEDETNQEGAAEVFEQIETLYEQREILLDTAEHVLFMARIRKCIETLLEKHEELLIIPTDDAEAIKKLKETYPMLKDLSAEHVVRVVHGPFSVSIVVAGNEYDRIFGKKSVGLHFGGTPINIIRHRNYSDEQSTIHHENIHNLTEGSVAIGRPIDRFLRNLKNYTHCRTLSAPENILKSSLRRLSSVRQYVDLLHGEIVAAFEQAEEQGFIYEKFPASHFEKKAWPFNTAGNDAVELVRTIKLEKKVTDDEKLKSVLQSLEEEIIRRFVETVEKIQKYLQIAESIGGKARDEVETLFYVLRPMQYRHIAAFLGEYYGQELLVENEILQSLTEFYSLDDLRGGVNLLRQKPDYLTPTLKNKISTRATSLIGGLVAKTMAVGLLSLEDKREYIRLIDELAERCGNQRGFGDLVEHVGYAFMDDFIERDIKNDFASLRDFYSSLRDDEKKDLHHAMEVYMDFIQDDLGLDDIEEIKERSLWKVLESLGWAKRMEEILRRS